MSATRLLITLFCALCLSACCPECPDVEPSTGDAGVPLDLPSERRVLPTPERDGGFSEHRSGTHVMCCAAGKCKPPPKGEGCPTGTVTHTCSDELVCEPDGSACWNECKPA